MEPVIASKAPFIDEQAEFVVKRARNISSDDVTALIDWVTTQGQALVGVKAPAAAAATGAPSEEPAAPAVATSEAQEDKPDEADTEVVSSTEAAAAAETKKAK